MAVFEGSRYIKTGLNTEDYGTPVLNSRERASFSVEGATYYTVVDGDTIDSIANIKYGNPVLSWAILDANPLYQSEVEIKAGDVLMIPDYDEVVSYCE